MEKEISPNVHILESSNELYNLPLDSIYYVENVTDCSINSFIEAHHTDIQQLLNKKFKLLPRKFVYVSLSKIKNSGVEQLIKLQYPAQRISFDIDKLTSDSVTLSGYFVARLFPRSIDDVYRITLLQAEPIDNLLTQLSSYLDSVNANDVASLVNYESSGENDIRFRITDDTGIRFHITDADKESRLRALAQNICDGVAELQRQNGLGYLEELLGAQLLNSIQLPTPTISRLQVTDDYRILLLDFDNIEITMSPLPKAVYILFLQHPEGIVLSSFTDYTDEFRAIYALISHRNSVAKMDQSIADLADTLSGSLNQKISRSNAAFCRCMSLTVAEHYMILGERGMAKKISLPISQVSLPRILQNK